MTREEFIGIAADAILRSRGFDPKTAHPEDVFPIAMEATAALDAVGAWQTREALEAGLASEMHDRSCQACNDRGCSFMRPLPCRTSEQLRVKAQALRAVALANAGGHQ